MALNAAATAALAAAASLCAAAARLAAALALPSARRALRSAAAAARSANSAVTSALDLKRISRNHRCVSSVLDWPNLLLHSPARNTNRLDC